MRPPVSFVTVRSQRTYRLPLANQVTWDDDAATALPSASRTLQANPSSSATGPVADAVAVAITPTAISVPNTSASVFMHSPFRSRAGVSRAPSPLPRRRVRYTTALKGEGSALTSSSHVGRTVPAMRARLLALALAAVLAAGGAIPAAAPGASSQEPVFGGLGTWVDIYDGGVFA